MESNLVLHLSSINRIIRKAQMVMRIISVVLLFFMAVSLQAQSALRKASSDFAPVPSNYDSLIHWNKDFVYIELELVRPDFRRVTYQRKLGFINTSLQKQWKEFRLTNVVHMGWNLMIVDVKGKIQVLHKGEQLRALIDTVASVGDAFLMLSTFEIVHRAMLPLNKLRTNVYSYKESNEGFYFLFSSEVDDCPITYGDVVLFVDRNKQVRLLQQEITQTSTYCR